MEKKSLSRTKVKRKNDIVDAAYAMFLENGISVTSMNDVAVKCGITRRTIYNYFESKTDLLFYLTKQKTDEINPDFVMDYDKNLNGLENVRLLLRKNFASYYKHLLTFLFITQVRIHLSYTTGAKLQDPSSSSMHNVFIGEFAQLIEIGREDGSIASHELDIKEHANTIYQLLYGYLTSISLGIDVDKKVYNKEMYNFETLIIESLRSK